MKKLKNFFRNEDGATAIEYGLIAALIAVGLIVALNGLGDSLDGVFNNAADQLDNAVVPVEGGGD